MNMKKILLSAVCLMMVGMQSMMAQATVTAPTMPEELTLADGLECYLYNVGAERFFGTNYSPARAENYGEKLLLVQVEEGVYRLKRQSDNYYYYSESGNFGRTSGTGTSAQFKFNKVDGGYTIQRMSNYDETHYVGARDDNTVYSVSETLPEYSGGMQAMMRYLSENVKYPPIAAENGIQGKAVCSFVINKDGSVSDVEIIRSAGDPSLDKEAIRVIKSMPKWKPGTIKGKPVRVKLSAPVKFSLY
jgi:TonB family protein